MAALMSSRTHDGDQRELDGVAQLTKVSTHALQVVALALVNPPEGKKHRYVLRWLERHLQRQVGVGVDAHQASVKGRLDRVAPDLLGH